MRRFLLLACVGVLIVAVPQASADDLLSVDLFDDATLETVDPTLSVLEAAAELLPDPASVTDEELASVGVSGDVTTLQLGDPEFVVDDDLAECPEADFTTATGIQQAITAAPPGSTIRVCPGIYTPINVNKTLTLYAPIQHGQATQCMQNVPPDPTKQAIIDSGNTNAIAVTLAANDIVLYGFTVQHVTNNPGILSLSTFSGYEILFNTVQENTIGLYLNASGTNATLVRHNCFRNNNRPGAAGGNGIYSDQGLRNATVQDNFFTGNTTAAMVFALNQQDLTIEHNDIVDDAGTIVLVNTQRATVRYNRQVDLGGSGIFVGGGVTDTVIRFNLIENPSTGITSNVLFTPVPNELVVEKNKVSDARLDGIRLTTTVNSLVSGNTVLRSDRDGVLLLGTSTNNQVTHNLSRDNVRHGMSLESQSSLNTIEQNKMLGNGVFDCYDETVGSGTAATANLWIKDIGKTENRPGLCKAPPS